MTTQDLANQINALRPGECLTVSEFDLQSLRGGGLWRTAQDDLMEKIIGSNVGTVITRTNPITGAVTFEKTDV